MNELNLSLRRERLSDAQRLFEVRPTVSEKPVWEEVCYDYFGKLHRMRVLNGWRYRTILTSDGVALSFVPDPPASYYEALSRAQAQLYQQNQQP